MRRGFVACALVSSWALGCTIDRTGTAARDGSPAADGAPVPMDAAADVALGDGPVAMDAGCRAGGEEVCAEDAKDEDCDGVIDEGCPFYFGRPSPVIRLHRSLDNHWSPWLSPDGLRLWFRAGLGPAGGVVHRADRPTVDDPFGTPVAIDDPGIASHDIASFTLSADERELIAEAAPRAMIAVPARLWRATRSRRDEPFGPFVELPGFAGGVGDEGNPSLRRDGLELLFVTDRDGLHTIWHALRDTPESPFGPPSPLGVPNDGDDDYTPSLTPDGLTLHFARTIPGGGIAIHRVTRTGTDGFASSPDLVIELAAAPGEITYFPMVSVATREIFFSSDRAWSPAEAAAIWRARLCRSGPCVEAEVPCPPGAVRSPDLRHCYGTTTDVASWQDGRNVCLASGGDLVSIHSSAELAFVMPMLGAVGGAWIGGNDADAECNVAVPGCTFAWTTGEPFLFQSWSTGEPNDAAADEDCMLLWRFGDRPFADANCRVPYPMICESELTRW